MNTRCGAMWQVIIVDLKFHFSIENYDNYLPHCPVEKGVVPMIVL